MDEVLQDDYEKKVRLEYRDTKYVIWEYLQPAASAPPALPGG